VLQTHLSGGASSNQFSCLKIQKIFTAEAQSSQRVLSNQLALEKKLNHPADTKRPVENGYKQT
jgi:hypothetical protein